MEIKCRRIRWLGHVLRMDQTRIPKVALRWTPPGKRKPGRPKTTWRQTVMAELSEVKLTWDEAQHAAQNRAKSGGYSKKFYTGRLRPEVQPLTLLYTIFFQKRHSFRIQSNLHYPDLDYPDFSIIRTLFSGPNFCMNINKLSSSTVNATENLNIIPKVCLK